MPSFLEELKRRNVVKVSVAYAAVAWLVAQVAETVFPVFDLSATLLRALFIILGLGLPIAVVLSWVYDLTPEGIQRSDDIPVNASPRRVSGRALDFVIIACLTVTVVFLVLDRHFIKPLPTDVVASLAVLPLTTELATDDDDLAYLGKGIADRLIMRLSRMPQLKVKSRSMIGAAESDAREIGALLDVDAVFMGRLSRRGDDLEVIVELVDTVDGTVMWSNLFAGRAMNLIGLESEVSAEIAEVLNVRLSDDERAQLTRAPTNNAAAYRLYLKGRFFWNKRSEEGLRRSVEFYQQAIDEDPDYALAWSGLADAYLMLLGWGFEPPDNTVALVRSAARRAIELDGSLAEPHATLGYLKTLSELDWVGAELEFKRAFELNPNYSTAHHWYAFYLSTIGRPKEAIAEILKARDSEPLSPIVNAEVSFFYIYDGQYDKALDELQAASLISPGFPSVQSGLIRAYALDGQIDKAIELYETGARDQSDSITGAAFGKIVLPKLGLHAEAREFYEYAVRESESRYVMPGVLGLMAASIGESDAAFTYFGQAIDEGSMVMSWLRDPFVADIRDDPRYTALFLRVGLEP